MTRAPGERQPINPRVDCVFQALFGDEAHKDILIDLLNAILCWPDPVVDVTMLPIAESMANVRSGRLRGSLLRVGA